MKRRPAGMKAFILVVIGQTISLLGSGMTMFAIAIWAYQETGQATTLSLLAVTGFAPVVLFSPIAGALVDRWNRRLVMMISDLAAGITTIMVFILLSSGNLEMWHLYVLNFLAGIFQAFQFPAYSAAVTMMVPKEHYGRANGLISLAGPASSIFSPILAAALIGSIGLEGIMIIDIVTFSAAIGMLLLVFIPQPEATEEGEAAKSNLLQESLFGFRYIFKRPSLLGLQLMFFYINLVGMLAFTLMTPMILSRSGNDEVALGSVMSAGSIGGLIGGLLLGAWGGPKRRVHGVLLGMAATSLFAQVWMGLAQTPFFWASANFMGGLIIPILNGSNQAIWQSKVAPDVQGRVFAVRRWIAQITAPVAMLLAGPLADKVTEPAMAAGGAYAEFFIPIVGSGPGSGMASMFVITGILGVVGGLGGYLIPAVRNVEDILPDHDVDLEALQQQAESEDQSGVDEAPAEAAAGSAVD